MAALETNLLTLGMAKQVEILTGSPQQVEDAIATAAALESQSKVLANLSVQSQRLSRQYERTIVQLRALQKERRDHQDSELSDLLNIMNMKQSKGEIYDRAADGFVFAAEQIRAAKLARRRHDQASKAYNFRYAGA